MNTGELSRNLRRMRVKRGMSLSQLARRMGTSAAAISRYETGWDRFELQTLTKLATALGCKVRIALEPERRKTASIGKRRAIRQIRRLFWDQPLKTSDVDNYPAWVVKRVLEYGWLEDVRAIRELIGQKEFLAVVAGIRFDTVRTRVFWECMLEKEGIQCTAMYSRKAVQSSWQA